MKTIRQLVMENLRRNGLETPLLQRRLIDAWPSVAGDDAAHHTTSLAIRRQTLYVSMTASALRFELFMRRSQLVERLNQSVGATIITDIRFC